ncbi:carbamate kinase [Streptomyces sp. NPDC046716]|uniref:carbamate kinase n=1 Tax=Streptomyces sp. NPDC046716 TaxID=3157093 RepID=UPI003407AA3F
MISPTAHRTVVVAVGGNALLRGGPHATIAEQMAAARTLAVPVTGLLDAGWRVVVTHGNGPQVGFIQRRADLVRELAPELPALELDMCVADAQGSLGYILAVAIAGRLRALGRDPGRVAALLTHTLVDADDPAFGRPTKPIGAHYDEATAHRLAAEHGWSVAPEPGRGWRRVVPSPRPRRILEASSVRTLSDAGCTVIAGGGGGIPLVETADGGLRGVAAVIDKDLTSALLAADLDAGLLVITTGVERVAVDFGGPGQRFLDRLTPTESQLLLDQGEFPEGSMGPKIRAALDFVSGAPHRRALITSPGALPAALEGQGGTWLEHGPAAPAHREGPLTAGRPQ